MTTFTIHQPMQFTHAQLEWRNALRRIWERTPHHTAYQQAPGPEVQLQGYIWRLQLYMARHFERWK